MDASMFADGFPGRLQPLVGQYPTKYGLMQYETFAFIPNELQQYPLLSPRAYSAINQASMTLARLSELSENAPGVSLYSQPIIRREAQSTSAMEGTWQPLETVLAQEYEVGGNKVGWESSLIEIFNYSDALAYGLTYMKEGRTINLSFIRELQEILVTGTPSDNEQRGTIRSSQVFIGSPTRKIEDARFVPMPPGQDLQIQMQALVDWWSGRKEAGLALLDMALFHYQFETLHPFTDGNGRIGRLLILLQMVERKILTFPILAISPWFEQRRREYQDRLLAVSTKGEWENWILFFCQGIEETAKNALLWLKKISSLQKSYHERVQHAGYGNLVLEICDHLFTQPYVRVSYLQHRFGKSETSIRNALKHLEELEVVSRNNLGRNVIFVADEIVDALR